MTTDASRRPIQTKRLIWLLVLTGVSLSSASAWFVLSRSPKPRIVWLPVSGANQTQTPAPLVRLKNEYLGLIAPLWRPRASKPPPIQVIERWMVISATVAREATPATLPATNDCGQRAWILSPEQLRDFQLRLEGNPGARIVREPGLPRGTWWNLLNEFEPGTILVRDRPPGRPNKEFGLKKLANAFRVQISESWTRLTDPQPVPNQITLRAIIPEGSSLLVDSAIAVPGRHEGYWFVFTPATVEESR